MLIHNLLELTVLVILTQQLPNLEHAFICLTALLEYPHDYSIRVLKYSPITH